ncbi:MAG: hypothetical protein QNK70_03700 [Crocinitomicaceae bacterium]
MRLKFIVLFILIITVNLCLGQVHFLPNINTKTEFNLMKGKPNMIKFGQVDAMKVLLYLKTDSLYFINTNYYKLHVDFCKDYLSYCKKGWEFNEENYNKI